MKVIDICCELSITEKTFYRWRSRYNGMEVAEVKCLRELEAGNSKFRDGCLNQLWFSSIKEARETIESWRIDYNEVCSHSALGYQPSSEFAEVTA